MFNLDEYEPVDVRIKQFYQDHPIPEGRILTEDPAFQDEGKRVVFRAAVYVGDVLVATGTAEESRDVGPVNQTSMVENAETSAIGRALANAGYSGHLRPSREEMQKVETHGAYVMKSGRHAGKTVQQVWDEGEEGHGWVQKMAHWEQANPMLREECRNVITLHEAKEIVEEQDGIPF